MAEQNVAEALEQQGGQEQEQTQENAEQAVVAETEESGEADEQADANEGDEEPADGKPKRLGGWQRKIQKLERELEVWREHALKGRNSDPEDESEPAPTSVGPRPNILTWTKSAEEFQQAEEAWFNAQLLAQEQRITKETNWNLSIQRAAAAYPDWREVVANSDVPISNQMQAALKADPEGAELVYLLASNPDEARKILRLPVATAMRELGKFQARLAREEQAEETTKPVSRAPKPPTPVKKPSPTAKKSVYDDNLSEEEWLRLRHEQLGGR